MEMAKLPLPSLAFLIRIPVNEYSIYSTEALATLACRSNFEENIKVVGWWIGKTVVEILSQPR